jgi:hypothetical protein
MACHEKYPAAIGAVSPALMAICMVCSGSDSFPDTDRCKQSGQINSPDIVRTSGLGQW